MNKKLLLIGSFLAVGVIFVNIYKNMTAMEATATRSALSSTEFRMPITDTRYDQVCWLSTHNAYAAERYGYVYANQYYTLQEQLEHGVRAFELDTYKRCWTKGLGIFGTEGCSVSMCHGECDATNKWIYKPWVPGTDALGFKTDGLVVFKNYLEKYKSVIITLTLENYVTEPGLLDSHIEASGIQNMILKPSDWNPVEKKGWPTLRWMLENNKRVVIFNDKNASDMHFQTNMPIIASSKYTYYQWGNMVQNHWGAAKDLNAALQQRGSTIPFNGTPRYLLELDWYADGGKILGGGLSDLISKIAGGLGKETPFGGDFGKLNGPALENFINRAVQEGLKPSGIAKGRYPNFIKVDYFHEGNPTPMSLVNKINQMATDPVKREQMFKPMPEPVKAKL